VKGLQTRHDDIDLALTNTYRRFRTAVTLQSDNRRRYCGDQQQSSEWKSLVRPGREVVIGANCPFGEFTLLRPPRRKRFDAGFTLVEQLVAVAVLAVTLAAIGRLVGSTLRGARQIEQHVSLVQAANSLLFNNMPARDRPTAPESEGEAWGHRWRMQVGPAAVDLNPAPENSDWTPMQVELLIKSPSGAAMRLQTIRLQRASGQ
jgi:general secretion pathway protein I